MLRLVVLLGVLAAAAAAQPAVPYSVELEELSAPAFPALHSFVAAEHGGRWLVVGGRTNGLHGFGVNPFPNEFASRALFVLDPQTGQAWSRALDELGAPLADALGSTNAQAVQRGDTLWVAGGYGHQTATGTKVTFPTLTALRVSGLVDAVANGGPLAPHVEAATDDAWYAVTGGHLAVAGGRFHLVGGHRFDGEYSGGFVQAYTEAVRSFRLTRIGGAILAADTESTTDATRLHRRDGNVTPFVFADGREGFAVYGGVFARIPSEPAVRQPAYGDGASLTYDGTFRSQFGHYTAPALPVFDASTGAMHTTFFGGMGQFYVDGATGDVVEDARVPFIDAVVTLSRGADGVSGETVMPVRMPGLLGTNAWFFLAPSVPRTDGGVVRLAELGGRTLVGHVYGGIAASQPNFDPATTASGRLFAVYLVPGTVSTAPPVARSGARLLAPVPNPTAGASSVTLALDAPARVAGEVFDALGRRVAVLDARDLGAGTHPWTLDAGAWPAGVYVVRVQVAGATQTLTQRLVRR